jgi:hypothetical protein
MSFALGKEVTELMPTSFVASVPFGYKGAVACGTVLALSLISTILSFSFLCYDIIVVQEREFQVSVAQFKEDFGQQNSTD